MILDTAQSDCLDAVIGIRPGEALDRLRRQRDKVREGVESSFQALFSPDAPIGLTARERLLIALHACRLSGAEGLAATYRQALDLLPDEANPTRRIEAGAPLDDRLDALMAYAETLILNPIQGDQAALEALKSASLSTGDIVALSQLVAFMSFQIRVVAGLALLAAPVAPANASDHDASNVLQPIDAHPQVVFTLEPLAWSPWLDTVDPTAATDNQLAVLKDSGPTATQSPYYLTLVHQPEILRHRSNVFNAIMYAPRGLSRAERELAATVVSRINGCVYCGSVHARRYEQLSKRNEVILQLFADPTTAGTTDRERAVIAFSVSLTLQPERMAPTDIAPLRKAGLDDLEILDLIHSIAIFAWANRLMLSLGEPRSTKRD